MKALLVISIGLLLVTPAYSRIGETVKQVEARYGQPQKVFSDGPGLRKIGYGYRGFMVMVYFSGGVSKRESFGRPDQARLPSDAINQLLALSAAPGTTWKSWQPPTAEKGERYWIRSDGAVLSSSGSHSGVGVIVFQDRNFRSSE